MEANHFRPGTVYPYLVEWNDERSTFQVRKMDENLTLGDVRGLRGGDKDADYKNYYLGIKYMIYCEDVNKNLVIHSFAVDYRTIYWGFSEKFKEFKDAEAKPDDLQDDNGWDALKENPGFNIPTDNEKKHYQEIVEEKKTGDYNKQLLAEMAIDQKIAPEVAASIIECFDENRVGSTTKILAFSDLHGSVLAYEIGVEMMEKLKKTNKDLITVCEGDAIGRKGRYYTGETEFESWNSGKFPELTSIYIIYHIRQLVEEENSNFIYLHGNHDYAIEYPTIMSYATNNYQLIFSHGMIEPQLLERDELQQITNEGNDWTKSLIYPKSLVGCPGVSIFAFSQDSIARKTKNNPFSSDHIDGLPKILENEKDRPENAWNGKAAKLKKCQIRDYLSNYFFIMANRMGYGFGEVVPRRTIAEMNDALMKLNDFAVGKQVLTNFNPIFTFGHDYSYEVWSYYAYLNKTDDDELSKFPLDDTIWDPAHEYKWDTVKKARLAKHLMARVFCVDGLHYLEPFDYVINNYTGWEGPYTKIRKYEGDINNLQGSIVPAKENENPDGNADGEENSEANTNEYEEEQSASEYSYNDSSSSYSDDSVWEPDFIERELKSVDGSKSVSFKRGVLCIYYQVVHDDKKKIIRGDIVGIKKYYGVKAFKLIVVTKSDEINDIYEFFFNVNVDIDDGNREKVVNAITDALYGWLNNNNQSPLFFIFSPSINTLECFQGVLGCMDMFKDAYFITTSSPWSGDSIDNNDYEKAQKLLPEIIPDDNEKYIELLDLNVENSYQYDQTSRLFKRPVAIKINLSNVDILVSKYVRSLNYKILNEKPIFDEDAIRGYYYALDNIAQEINVKFNGAPAIPMTSESLINLIKYTFVRPHEDYILTFRPEKQEHIPTLQSSLNKYRKMKLSEPITISTADVKWYEDNAIANLSNSLSRVFHLLEDFDEKSFEDNNLNPILTPDGNANNPLILTSDYEEVLSNEINVTNNIADNVNETKDEVKPLGDFIVTYDEERAKMFENNILLGRLYSLYSTSQHMGWEEEKQEEEDVSNNEMEQGEHPANDQAMGGVVTSKKKAIIISIILGAILIIVIVIVVIVASRNEGFKPRMRQIKI